jgi:hypothetical protein
VFGIIWVSGAELPSSLYERREARAGTGNQIIQSYGSWSRGTYDALSVGLTKRMGKHFSLGVDYARAHAIDNDLNSNLISDTQTAGVASPIFVTGPTHSFVGVVLIVTDSTTGKTNAHGAFVSGSGDPNEFGNVAPPFVNMDIRVTKQFNFRERRLSVYADVFNLFNRDNPAAVQQMPGRATPFGTVLQVLPRA